MTMIFFREVQYAEDNKYWSGYDGQEERTWQTARVGGDRVQEARHGIHGVRGTEGDDEWGQVWLLLWEQLSFQQAG